MADVNLKQLADGVKLDPKVIRRMLRKKFPRVAESGKYVFNTESALYPQILAACEELKAEIPKKQARKEHPKREREPSVSKSEINDDRGFLNLDGNIWGTAIIPRPDGSGISDVKSVWLGRTSEVLPYIEGRTKQRPVYETSEQEMALRDIIEGKSAIPPMPKGDGTEKATKTGKPRRQRRPRLTKRG